MSKSLVSSFFLSSRIFWSVIAIGLFAASANPAAVARATDRDGPTILVFGDSFTAGLGLPREAAFPVRLENWLRSHGVAARVINAGVSGDTTSTGMARLDRALAERPDMVILELGTNDALRGVNPAVTKQNLATIITRVRSLGARVLLIGILAPPNWGEEYRLAFNRIYPELAQAYATPLYPSFLEGVALEPKYNQADGLHPNQRGVEQIVEHLAPIVLRLLASERAGDA